MLLYSISLRLNNHTSRGHPMKKIVAILLVFGASSWAADQDQKEAAAGKQAQDQLSYTAAGDTGLVKVKQQKKLLGYQLPFQLTLTRKVGWAPEDENPCAVKFSQLTDKDRAPLNNLMKVLSIQDNTVMVRAFHNFRMHRAFGCGEDEIYVPEYLPLSFLQSLKAKQPAELELSHDPKFVSHPIFIKALCTLSEEEQKALATLAAQLK